MDMKRIVDSRYIYEHDTLKWPPDAADVHDVYVVRKHGPRRTILCIAALLMLLNASNVVRAKDISATTLIWCVIAGALVVILIRRDAVEKESVVILPAFGVQFETHYKSGRTVRCFVPLGKILTPVLNECITQMTCYWSLALVLHDENELMLVFKQLQPPHEMLVPIWKALRTASAAKAN